MENHSWLKDERLSQIAPEKLSFIQKVIFDINTLSEEERFPFLMALATSNQFKTISFSKEESNLLVAVMKDYMEETDHQRLTSLLRLMKSNTPT